MPPKRAARRSKRVATPPPSNKGPSEAELVDTFHLFAVPRHTVPRIFTEDDDEYYNHQTSDGDEDPDEAVLKVADVRRALAAVDIGRPPADFFEPGERCISLEHFVMLANTLAEAGDHDEDNGDGDEAEDDAYEQQEEEAADDDEGGGGFIVDDDDEDEDMAGGFEKPKPSKSSNARSKKSDAKQPKSGGTTTGKRKKSRAVVDEEKQRQEIDHAFALFTYGRSESNSVITLADLRRVARELRDDVDDATLRRMLGEATGDERAAGVGRDEFEAVMRRAGVFA